MHYWPFPGKGQAGALVNEVRGNLTDGQAGITDFQEGSYQQRIEVTGSSAIEWRL